MKLRYINIYINIIVTRMINQTEVITYYNIIITQFGYVEITVRLLEDSTRVSSRRVILSTAWQDGGKIRKSREKETRKVLVSQMSHTRNVNTFTFRAGLSSISIRGTGSSSWNFCLQVYFDLNRCTLWEFSTEYLQKKKNTLKEYKYFDCNKD